ncbi:hypothetical protein L7F22_051101 [Adiantum nelumboides]|nr:hypothetical protein [Adiantum nelumboides]
MLTFAAVPHTLTSHSYTSLSVSVETPIQAAMASLHPSSVEAPKYWLGQRHASKRSPVRKVKIVVQAARALHASDRAELLAFLPSLLEAPLLLMNLMKPAGSR